MSNFRIHTNHVRIRDLAETYREREYPVAQQETPIADLIPLIVRFPRCRLLYVVDEQGRIAGTISLARLVRHVLHESHEPQIHGRHIVGMLAHETAGHLMRPRPIYATEEELVRDVLKRVVDANIKEFPVVDEQLRIIGDLTVVDLLAYLIGLPPREEDS